MANVPWFSLLTMVTLSATLSFMTEAQDCFGGIETFEKMATMTFSAVVSYKSMLQQPGQAITRDCINLCKQQAACLSFGLNYTSSSCVSYNVNSVGRGDDLITTTAVNFFEKICFRGVAKNVFDSACRDRLWVFDRVRDSYLDGHVDKELRNIRTKEDCEKLCITEERFRCRSADYDEIQHICRMSRETRRTKPNAFKTAPGSMRNYLENQCAPPHAGGTSDDRCRHSRLKSQNKNDEISSEEEREAIVETKGIPSQVAIRNSENLKDYFAFVGVAVAALNKTEKKINLDQLSGDSSRTIGKGTELPSQPGAVYGELQCFFAPGTCRYDSKSDVTVLTPDHLQFASSSADCMGQCDAETAFNCWSYSYADNRCQLSGDSSRTIGKGTELPSQPGAVYGELQCFFEQCDNGVMTFEKMTGVLLRSAQGVMMSVSNPGSLGNTLECIQYCLDDGMECPAFSDQYQNMRCDRLDRNSNGRSQELIARDGENYFEKICLQGPEAQACSDKAWAFERTLGFELSESLYKKTIPKVETRRECIQLCLGEREFTCRSARYNEDTGDCKLSHADRRTEPGRYYRSEDSRISYLENSCLPAEEHCPYVETEDAYASYTNVILTEGIADLQACREICTGYTKFPCRSFSFYSSSLQCFLSGDDKASGGSAAIQRRPGIVYFERMCPQLTTTDHTGVDTTETEGITYTSTLGFPTVITTDHFTERGSTLRPRPPYQPQEPQRPECSPTERLIFEKITGYEPFGVTSTLLYRGDSTTPGITAECVRRCQALSDCRSFILDHQRYECSSIQDPPIVHPSDFRASIGKTFFGGICVPAYIGCSKLWVFERIMDHELQGVTALDVIRVVSLEQCEQHCLETRKYVCKSVNYFHLRRECHVYGDDRAAATAELVSSSRVDYVENQCLVDTSYCPYQKTEPDLAMLYVTKSLVETPSTLHCERECNREREFNCRSYTFWKLGGTTSVCMLSGESRLTGQAIGLQYRQGASFANKICKPPSESRVAPTVFPPPIETPTKGTTTTHTTPPSTKGTQIPFRPPPPQLSTHPPLRPVPRAVCAPEKYTYEKVIGHDVRSLRKERIPTRSPIGVLHQCHTDCQRIGERCRGFVIQYKSYQNCYLILGGLNDMIDIVPSADSVYFEKICLRERSCRKYWTFERVLNHELHAEPIREVHDVLEKTDCEDLCLRERPSCLSATYHHHSKFCRLFGDTRRSKPKQFHFSNDDVEYLENQCVSEPPTCQYRDFPERFLQNIDRLTRAYSLQDCQRQCDIERQFTCRSVNYEVVARDCALSSEDIFSSPQGVNSLQGRRNSLYSEKGNCEQVSVQCNQQDMMLTIHFESPFNGRVYAKGNPGQCFVVGTGQTTLQFAVSLGTKCGTRVEPNDRYVNEVVVQQHPVIMTDHDKTIKVVCSFETLERTYTMSGPGVGAPGMDVGRTNFQAPLTSIVTNTAPPPNVVMRVLDSSGRDARAVGLGEELTLKIELRESSSAFAIFARNLYARSSNGESLFLIDSTGCPTDSSIFPALQMDIQDGKSLYSTFKAFRFPSTGMVNFEVQIRFCQEKCDQARCGDKGASLGRRKRDTDENSNIFPKPSTHNSFDDEDVYFDNGNYESFRTVIHDDRRSIMVPRSDDYDVLEGTVSSEHEVLYYDTTTSAELEEYQSSFRRSVAALTTDKSAANQKSSNDADHHEESQNQNDEAVNNERQTDQDPNQTEETRISFADFYSTHSSIGTSRMQQYSEESVHVNSRYEEHVDGSVSSGTATPDVDKVNRFRKFHYPSTPNSKDLNSPTSVFYQEDKDVTRASEKHSTSSHHKGDGEILVSSVTDSTLTEGTITPLNKISERTTEEFEPSQRSPPFATSSLSESVHDTTKPTSKPYSPLQNGHTTSFNRKFAFISHEEGNPSNDSSFNSENGDMATPFSFTINNSKILDDPKDKFQMYPRPDIRRFGEPQPGVFNANAPHPQPPTREDTRSPYGSQGMHSKSKTQASEIQNRGYGSELDKRQHSLPHFLPYTQRQIQPPTSLTRGWGGPPMGPPYPPLHSRPMEIQNVPAGWNADAPSAHALIRENESSVPQTSHGNEKDERLARVVTPLPPFNQRTKDNHANPTSWGERKISSHQLHSSPIQIQRPLEIIDDPSRRRDYPGFMPPPRHQSHHPRPVEITGPFHGEHPSVQKPPGSFDLHRPNDRHNQNSHSPHSRPIELPNERQMPPWGAGPSDPNGIRHGDRPLTGSRWNNDANPQRPRDVPKHDGSHHIYRNDQHQGQNSQVSGKASAPGQDHRWRDSTRLASDSGQGMRNNMPPYQQRQNEVIATTQKSVPEEVPLSLAILVGEDGKTPNSHNQNNRHAKHQDPWRPNHSQFNRGLQRHNIINTPRPSDASESTVDKVCTSKATVIATAVSVTLVYLGIVAAAVVIYRWYRKNKRRKEMAANPIHFPPNPTSANVTYSTPDVTFRNVYGNFPVSSTSTT